MRKFLLLFSVFVLQYGYSQTHLYVHEDAEHYVAETNIIAILPFDVEVKLRPNAMKKLTAEQLVEMEKAEGLDVQRAMYSWFLKRKKRGDMRIEVLSPQKTNAILQRNGVDLHNLDKYLPGELGAMLGVDALVMGDLETSKPMSDGASIVVGALFGFFGSTNKGVINLDIVHTADETLVVNYNKKVSGSLGSSSEDMINVLMRKVTRRIPYTG
ncbi:hypothetical protein [Robertkochia solimangrovi]|uniref:hypothetical protein n=1 Tax=Robertkochia solimangrovi TaxID=2213046 RepID=UPI00117FA34E|nr:hypothetical protein [Robertkochia solimangrovi]TRZ46106.1 hypothetical protein DMZ48_02245 [Robertkochia solimangrovi]